MLLQQQQHHAQQQQLVASSSVHHSHFPGQLHIGAMPLQLSNLGTEHHALQLAQSQAWGTPHGRAPSLQFSQHYQAAAHSPYLHESLSHSAILSAALSDPTGSLSHIDISLLGGLAQQPISGMPNPVITQPMTSSIQMVKSETQSKSGGDNEMQQGAGFVSVVSSTPTSQQDSKGHLNTAASDVVHPEVGDIIGDGDMSHEGVIAHFKNYSMNVGFSMTRNFDNLDSKGRYRRVRVACKQGGLPRKTAKHENPALQRERTSQKVGCPFEVTIWRTKQRPGGLQSTQEEWVVTNVKGVNHGPCTLLGNTYHPLSKTHDGIHKDVQVEIKARLKANQQAAIVASAGLVSSPSSPSPNVHAEQSNMSPDTRLSAGDSALLHQEGENYVSLPPVC